MKKFLVLALAFGLLGNAYAGLEGSRKLFNGKVFDCARRFVAVDAFAGDLLELSGGFAKVTIGNKNDVTIQYKSKDGAISKSLTIQKAVEDMHSDYVEISGVAMVQSDIIESTGMKNFRIRAKFDIDGSGSGVWYIDLRDQHSSIFLCATQ